MGLEQEGEFLAGQEGQHGPQCVSVVGLGQRHLYTTPLFLTVLQGKCRLSLVHR